MAQNMFRRAMAYLGLVDEEYDDLDRAQGDSRPYRSKPEPAPRSPRRATTSRTSTSRPSPR